MGQEEERYGPGCAAEVLQGLVLKPHKGAGLIVLYKVRLTVDREPARQRRL